MALRDAYHELGSDPSYWYDLACGLLTPCQQHDEVRFCPRSSRKSRHRENLATCSAAVRDAAVLGGDLAWTPQRLTLYFMAGNTRSGSGPTGKRKVTRILPITGPVDSTLSGAGHRRCGWRTVISPLTRFIHQPQGDSPGSQSTPKEPGASAFRLINTLYFHELL